MNCEKENFLPSSEAPLYKTLSAPIDVQLELTQNCNNSCLHCYNFWERKNLSFGGMTESRVKYAIDKMAREGIFYLTFTGGEPLLNPSVLLVGIEEAGRYGIVTSLNSNLTSVSEDLLLRFRDLGLRRVLTSMISYDEDTHDVIAQRHGSFGETISGIKKAQQAGLEVIVNMVVTKLNLDQVYQTGDFCNQELGINNFCATKASPSLYNREWIEENGLTPPELLKMLESLVRLRDELGIKIDTLEPIPHCFFDNLQKFSPLSKRKCVAALTTCTIGADGEVRPCSHTEKHYGNIFGDGLVNSWIGMAQWRTGELLPYPCKECKELAECGGGCRVVAASTHQGDYTAEDPFMGDPKNRAFPLSEMKDAYSGIPNLPFRLAPSLRIRREEFGGVVDNSLHQTLLVNSESFNLVSRLRGKTFFLDELALQEEVPKEEVYRYFYNLWRNKFIQSINETDEPLASGNPENL